MEPSDVTATPCGLCRIPVELLLLLRVSNLLQTRERKDRHFWADTRLSFDLERILVHHRQKDPSREGSGARIVNGVQENDL